MSASDPTKRFRPPDAPGVETSETHAVAEFFRAHGFFLILSGSLFVVLVLGLALFRHASARRKAEAARQWEHAQTPSEYESTAEKFPRTPYGPLALLGAAAEWFQEGAYENAISAYDRFLKRYPDHPMAEAARLNRSTCEEARGRLEKALAGYETLLAEGTDSYVRPQVVLALGRLYAATGRHTEARILYEDYLLADSDSLWRPSVEAALREVNRQRRKQDLSSEQNRDSSE